MITTLEKPSWMGWLARFPIRLKLIQTHHQWILAKGNNSAQQVAVAAMYQLKWWVHHHSWDHQFYPHDVNIRAKNIWRILKVNNDVPSLGFVFFLYQTVPQSHINLVLLNQGVRVYMKDFHQLLFFNQLNLIRDNQHYTQPHWMFSNSSEHLCNASHVLANKYPHMRWKHF